MKSRSLRTRFRGCLLGLACGDAVGTTVEFSPRGTFEPVTDMVGGGPFRLKPGQWTDDTSMALCLAESLLEREGFDPEDQMRRYVRWWREGHLSATGACFDIGNTVAGALGRFKKTGNPWAGSTDPHSAGNGSIMRLAPVVLFYYPHWEEAVHYAGESSRTTHGAQECVDACRLLASILCRALDGRPKREVLSGGDGEAGVSRLGIRSEKVASIARGDYLEKSVKEIRGTGYVVASLEAALYCFAKTDSFQEAVLMAANLGNDADTTAAVCGQIAGAFYGESAIPQRWLERLAMADLIRSFADRFLERPGPQWETPFDRSYWIVPGKVLAGAYPGSPVRGEAKKKLERMLQCGVRRIINLMEPDEVDHSGSPFEPYEGIYRELAQARGLSVSVVRYPIPDLTAPTPELMNRILDDMDRSVSDGCPVYVHCWGGRGRTGTVVGCYLVRHGMTGEAALEHIAWLRRRVPDRLQPSPETSDQVELVKSWASWEAVLKGRPKKS
ncbi:MAG: ADP-ribosylglycohydrolase family protein [Desulfacinum sp.]|nr:ADP-ribosylglycohydrolase family protein [Desulfacinum sp.]MBZ4659940.1 draG [Desulfacinum sp.]